MNGSPRRQSEASGSAVAVDAVGRALAIKKAGLKRSILKFAVVGVINNAIGYGTFVVLSLAGMPAIAAMTISYSLGMAVSFAGNRKWTFGHEGRMAPALLRFLAVNAVGYTINFTILKLFVEGSGFPQIPVQLVAVGLVAVVTFLLMRLWAFRETSANVEDTLTK
ncbi:GtrA family protein [Arthrobacter sp.]|uniref:GtrA family protein n=1 Tax=Arthrobacter sp. TaxID=1667 RepID=UPI003399E206